MEAVSYTPPVTDLPDPNAMAARPALAHLTQKNRVKLRLSASAFQEAGEVMSVISKALEPDLGWGLSTETARSRAGLALLLDVYEQQMRPYALADLNLVTLTLSRCEALYLWELWAVTDIPPAEVPSLAAVMNALHLLLDKP